MKTTTQMKERYKLFNWYGMLLLLVFSTAYTSLEAAATFQFNPSQPVAGQTVTVNVTDTTPWAYVDVTAIGPNTVGGSWGGVVNNGNGSWTWTWTLSGLQAGNYAVQFTSDNGSAVRGQTTLMVTGSATATFSFNPSQPTAGQTVTVNVTDSSPWVYVGVTATGPNTVDGSWVGVVNNGNGTWTWTWTLSGLQGGNYNVRFTSDNGATVRGETTLTVTGASTATFSFNPSNPTEDEMVTVNVTDNSPWVYVGLTATGPNTISGSWVGVVNNGNGTWTWTWTLSGLQEGNYAVRFYSDNNANLRGQTSLNVAAGSSLNDAWFQFSPPNPSPGQPVQVKVTSRTAYANISLNVNLNGIDIPVTENGYQANDDYYDGPTHTWTYDLPALQSGNHVVTFTADNGATQVDQTNLPVQTRSLRSVTNSPFGFNGHFWWTNNCSGVGDRIQRFIDEYTALGATTIRIGIDWAAVEASEGVRNYSNFDEILTRFNDAGIKVIALFYTAPAWATDDGGAWGLGKKLNRNKVGAMRATAQHMANRYPFINHWEFWNEPHFRSVMTEGEEFSFWFRNFSQAIKIVRSSDKVSFGTIVSFDGSPHTSSFVKNVMSALEGYQPDAISLHPYSGSSVNTDQITQIHNLVPHIPLWITEYGWNDYTEGNQTTNLEAAINWMRNQNYIEFSIMHMLHDWDETKETYCDFSDDGPGNERFGLVTLPFYQGLAYHRKQAWYKFRELALGLGNCSIPSNQNAGSITSNSASISWANSGGASQYQVAYKPSADVSGWQYKTSTSNNTSITGLTASTQYVYLVRAYCATSGWTAWTTNAYFTTLTGCLPPSGLWSGSLTTSSASISWNPVGGASQYEVAYKPSADVSGWQHSTINTNYTSLTGLTAATQYVFVVRANCTTQGGWTSYSSNAYFTTLSNCSPPTGLTASAVTSTSVNVAWAGMSGATQYTIAYKPSADVSGWQYRTINSNSTSLTGLEPDKQYVFVVRAYCPNRGGWTAFSSNAYFTTLSGCQTPTGLSAFSSTSTAFMSWGAVGNATAYYVAYKPRNYGSWSYRYITVNSVTVTGLASGTAYVFIVAANCPGYGWTPYSANYYFSTVSGGPFVVSPIDRNEVNKQIYPELPKKEVGTTNHLLTEIYPNPVESGLLQLRLPLEEESNVSISLMSQTGRVINLLFDESLRPGKHQLSFDLPELKPGLYMIRVMRGSTMETLKFVKR